MYRNERGGALLFVFVTALLCAIAAYAILFVVLSAAKQGEFFEGRLGARYLAEAGLVIAQEKLFDDPNYPDPACATPPVQGQTRTATEFIDTNGDGIAAAPDPSVQVTVTNCGQGLPHEIRVKAVF